jgi:hypothetical protein
MTLRRPLPVLLFCVFVPATSASAAFVLDDVTVRVYDAAGLDPATARAALNLAAATLAPGAHVWWRHCNVRNVGTACERSPEPGERILRIVRSRDATDSRPSRGQLRSASPLLPLGDAFVDPGTQSAVLATIYLDRVRVLARAGGVTEARLLGHAIAHEIGHLLLASKTHGARGLMRPVWSSEELRRGRAADWVFSDQELAAIRARLAAANGPKAQLPPANSQSGRSDSGLGVGSWESGVSGYFPCAAASAARPALRMLRIA